MNFINHFKELKYRSFYISFSFLLSFLICFRFKETLIFINFWSYFKDTPLYYSGIFEYYITILELCFFFSFPIFLLNFLFHLYAFLRPSFTTLQLNYFRLRIFLYFITISITTVLLYYVLFPIIYQDFVMFENNIEFLPNIVKILHIQNYILVLNSLIFLIFFKIKTISGKDRKIFIFVGSCFAMLITPPGIEHSLLLSFLLFILFEIALFLFFLFKNFFK